METPGVGSIVLYVNGDLKVRPAIVVETRKDGNIDIDVFPHPTDREAGAIYHRVNVEYSPGDKMAPFTYHTLL